MAEFAAASFREDPYAVEMDGHTYVFPVLSAAKWLALLTDANGWPARVLHHADADSYEAFLDQVEAGVLGPADVTRLARLVFAEQAGRSWWEAERLARSVLGTPALTAAVLVRGLDPSRLTLAAFLAVVWSRATEGASQADRMAMEAQLMAPPPEAMAEMGDEMDLGAVATMFRGMQGVRVG